MQFNIGGLNFPKSLEKYAQTMKTMFFSDLQIEMKKEVKAEMRSPKTGRLKPQSRIRRYPASPPRRSAPGEGLARDTGALERLIASNRVNGNKAVVGFLKNKNGFNYARYWEFEAIKKRPTLFNAYRQSKPAIFQHFRNRTNIINAVNLDKL